MNTKSDELPPDSEIVFSPARDLVRWLVERRLGAEELMSRFLARIEEVNPVVNAIVTLLPEVALEGARAADAALARGETPGPLHGLPVAIKDLTVTRGIRTTYGSPIYRDLVPAEDALYVQRLREAGAIVIGKTNTPEFGAGSHTFNPVFGPTRNPYATGRTCGGSSGGAAVAVACGMLPVTDGTDLGGSLRNPASWSNVIGFRTSPGRVPVWPRTTLHGSLSVAGPIARNVAGRRAVPFGDGGSGPPCAALDRDAGEPISRAAGARLRRDAHRVESDAGRLSGGGGGPRGMRRRCRQFRRGRMRGRGSGSRSQRRGRDLPDPAGVLLRRDPPRTHPRHRELMKDTVIWDTERGLALSALDVAHAEAKRVALFDRVVDFFGRFDFLVCPTTQVPPFPVEIEWVREINGVELEIYYDWMATCYAITVTGCPSISVPAGFTSDGLPVGIQIVGPPKCDFEVLQIADAYEKITRFPERRPPLGMRGGDGRRPRIAHPEAIV